MLKRLFILIIISISPLASALPDDHLQAISIQADSATQDEKKKLTIYHGNVIIEQGSILLNASSVEVQRTPEDKNKTVIKAFGSPAEFQQQPEADKPIINARAKKIVYSLDEKKLTLIGDALLKQGDSQIKSDTIDYFVDKEVFNARQSTDGKTKNRVEMIIPPSEK